MINKIPFMIPIVLVLLGCVFITSCAKASQKNSDIQRYTLATKFGKLIFYEDEGTPGSVSKIIKLNGKTILHAKTSSDENAFRPHYMRIIIPPFGIQYSSKQTPSGKRVVRREIIGVGEDANCFKKFIILDFSSKKPFVSKSFGYNPKNEFCLKLRKISWGEHTSYIYLEGPMKYLYHTGGSVIGPM